MTSIKQLVARPLKRLAATVLYWVSILALLLGYLAPVPVNAAALTTRKVTLGSSANSTRTVHTFNFTTATTASIGSMSFDYCTTPSGACTGPTGLDTQEASLAIGTQVGATGFSVHANTDTNTIVITRTAASLAASTAVTMPFGTGTGSTNGPTNSSTNNETFYVRVTTYTSTDGTTGSTDTGVVAASTAQQISFTGTMDESLTFCTGTSGITTSSCGAATGSSISFGTFSASATSSGVSQIGVGTNAASGYSVTITGATLTSGSNTISALSSQTASTTGTEQFGLNLRDNATPNVGTDADGAGDATPTANYNTVDQFRFVTGDSVASDAEPDSFRRFHAAYIVNVGTDTEPGTYTATLTYICTATF